MVGSVGGCVGLSVGESVGVLVGGRTCPVSMQPCESRTYCKIAHVQLVQGSANAMHRASFFFFASPNECINETEPSGGVTAHV